MPLALSGKDHSLQLGADCVIIYRSPWLGNSLDYVEYQKKKLLRNAPNNSPGHCGGYFSEVIATNHCKVGGICKDSLAMTYWMENALGPVDLYTA